MCRLGSRFRLAFKSNRLFRQQGNPVSKFDEHSSTTVGIIVQNDEQRHKSGDYNYILLFFGA